MRSFEIRGSKRVAAIHVGESVGTVDRHVGRRRAVIITDGTVRGLHGDAFPPYEHIEIGTGEENKTLETARGVYERLLELEADRATFILGIGGGIVCDTAGFVASTYLRGLSFGLVPTTLLSQVDAGVGGKTGVNLRGYKNIVGVFNQPEFVLCDMGLLKTLPERELRCGLAEVVKHGAIADPELFSYLEENRETALQLDPEVTKRLVHDSLRIKSRIVNRDETEKGARRMLNFGHTFGHAMESALPVSHGEAVGAGMILAAELSVRRGRLKEEARDRIMDLLKGLGLPTGFRIEGKSLVRALRRDKKREGGTLHFVLLKDIGHAVIETMPLRELEKTIREILPYGGE